MITSFLVIIFFSWLIIFFSPKATKKITQPRKKITHQQTKLFIQRKPHYIYDMTFLCPPPFFSSKSERNFWGTTRIAPASASAFWLGNSHVFHLRSSAKRCKILNQEKKLLTNKRSYSSNGNPIISMI